MARNNKLKNQNNLNRTPLKFYPGSVCKEHPCINTMLCHTALYDKRKKQMYCNRVCHTVLYDKRKKQKYCIRVCYTVLAQKIRRIITVYVIPCHMTSAKKKMYRNHVCHTMSYDQIKKSDVSKPCMSYHVI